MPLTSFSELWINELAELDTLWEGGDDTEPEEVHHFLEAWRVRLGRPATPDEEWFDIVDSTGKPCGYSAPRWFCHLTGLRHRVVHVILTTPQNLLILQLRAHDKPEWPSLFDTTVGGHLKAGQDWEAGVLAEIGEEIGLSTHLVEQWLVEGNLTSVGVPYERYGVGDGIPPMRNRQINQLYTGQLTEYGLASLHFADHEVAGVFLCTPAEANRMVAVDFLIAPGLSHAFPRWWEWYHS